MSTNFPGGLDNTSNLIDNATDLTPTATTHAQAHNNLADAVIAVETALGINPKGSYADVAHYLLNTVVKTPGSIQTISPSADAVAFAIKQGNNTYTSDLQQWQSSTGSVLAFVDKSGNFSAQALKVNGTALASTHLSDSNALQRQAKLASNVGFSNESQVVGFDIIQGVTPGRTSATPQNALQVSASNTWNLTIHNGAANVQGTDDIAQGMYGVTQNVAATLSLSTQAPAVNPRVDAIVLQVNDAEYTGRTPANNFAFVQVVGTPTSGANLTNLNGAPAVPASSLLLAYILVLTTDTGVQAANVSDQRILTGPAIWGEDNHRYRLGVDATGNLFLGQVV